MSEPTDTVTITRAAFDALRHAAGRTPFGGSEAMPHWSDLEGVDRNFSDPSEYVTALAQFLGRCHARSAEFTRDAATSQSELLNLKRSLRTIGAAINGEAS